MELAGIGLFLKVVISVFILAKKFDKNKTLSQNHKYAIIQIIIIHNFLFMKSKFLLSMSVIALVFGFSACSLGSKDTTSTDTTVTPSTNTVTDTATDTSATKMAPYVVSEWTQYEHANFNLSYPKDWEMQENVYGTLVAVLSPILEETDIFSENCNVVLDDSAEASDYSVKDYFDASVAQLSTFITGYEEIGRGDIKVGGKEGYYIAYNGVQGEYGLSWVQYLTKGETNHYILTCTSMKESFPAYKGAFDEIAGKMSVK